MDKDKPLTTGKIAEYCKVNVKTVLKWIEDKKLRAYQLPSGTNRIRAGDFLEFLYQYQIPVPKKFKKELKPRILIVDDEPLIIKGVERALEDEKYAVESASDGFEAGEKIARFQPDLILLDLRMPNLDGYEVMRRIRSNPETKDIKIIVLSAYIDAKDKNRLLQYNINGMVEKPFSHETLLKTLNALLKMVVITCPLW